MGPQSVSLGPKRPVLIRSSGCPIDGATPAFLSPRDKACTRQTLPHSAAGGPEAASWQLGNIWVPHGRCPGTSPAGSPHPRYMHTRVPRDGHLLCFLLPAEAHLPAAPLGWCRSPNPRQVPLRTARALVQGAVQLAPGAWGGGGGYEALGDHGRRWPSPRTWTPWPGHLLPQCPSVSLISPIGSFCPDDGLRAPQEEWC